MLDDNIDNYKWGSVVWLPNSNYNNLKPVANKNSKQSHYNRKDWVEALYKISGKKYKGRNAKIVNGQLVLASDLTTPVITLTAYDNEVNLHHIVSMTEHLFECGYKYAVTITPINSLEPFSFGLMIRDIVDRGKRWSGANRDKAKCKGKNIARINYTGVIEFGDKEGGIHAHLLIDSWIPEEKFIYLCRKAGALCDIIKLQDKTEEEQKKICNYFTSRQFQYSDIDEKKGTLFSETLTLFKQEK